MCIHTPEVHAEVGFSGRTTVTCLGLCWAPCNSGLTPWCLSGGTPCWQVEEAFVVPRLVRIVFPLLLISPGSFEQYLTFSAWETIEMFSRTDLTMALIIWIALDLVTAVTQLDVFQTANHWCSDFQCIS